MVSKIKLKAIRINFMKTTIRAVIITPGITRIDPVTVLPESIKAYKDPPPTPSATMIHTTIIHQFLFS